MPESDGETVARRAQTADNRIVSGSILIDSTISVDSLVMLIWCQNLLIRPHLEIDYLFLAELSANREKYDGCD